MITVPPPSHTRTMTMPSSFVVCTKAKYTSIGLRRNSSAGSKIRSNRRFLPRRAPPPPSTSRSRGGAESQSFFSSGVLQTMESTACTTPFNSALVLRIRSGGVFCSPRPRESVEDIIYPRSRTMVRSFRARGDEVRRRDRFGGTER